jgi:hypothetical protein
MTLLGNVFRPSSPFFLALFFVVVVFFWHADAFPFFFVLQKGVTVWTIAMAKGRALSTAGIRVESATTRVAKASTPLRTLASRLLPVK